MISMKFYIDYVKISGNETVEIVFKLDFHQTVNCKSLS